jgi:uncharacterized protein YbjT (DUF2867 family)
MAQRRTNGAGTPGAEILITGATGYVGRRLITALEKSYSGIRCLARDPDRLRDHVGPETVITTGDLLNPASLGSAFEGIKVAYYLVHSMEAGKDFEARDRQAVHGFVAAARSAGVRRVIYLGALGHGDDLSPHLASGRTSAEFSERRFPPSSFGPRSSSVRGVSPSRSCGPWLIVFRSW